MAKSPFKLQSGNTTPFKKIGSSPLKADFYGAVEYVKKNPYKVVKTGVKTGIKGAVGTAGAVVGALYTFGKTSVERKKAGLSGFNFSKPKINKGFNFNKK